MTVASLSVARVAGVLGRLTFWVRRVDRRRASRLPRIAEEPVTFGMENTLVIRRVSARVRPYVLSSGGTW
ncbi:hypothetical protein [Actinoalloteichus fjordicus]|uniref:Uncharacterized protein n=1 Tax=Actinoalloteichus fjordicus TaxID=1612552 RepID=A0AAC9LE59_9PSEU|nr:hypothetical protein [Actinoalloteichus fjordicus]APU15195.1 hypothetical protein UA74_15715 [Actinoalloteichus fjordicus]